MTLAEYFSSLGEVLLVIGVVLGATVGVFCLISVPIIAGHLRAAWHDKNGSYTKGSKVFRRTVGWGYGFYAALLLLSTPFIRALT